MRQLTKKEVSSFVGTKGKINFITTCKQNEFKDLLHQFLPTIHHVNNEDDRLVCFFVEVSTRYYCIIEPYEGDILRLPAEDLFTFGWFPDSIYFGTVCEHLISNRCIFELTDAETILVLRSVVIK